MNYVALGDIAIDARSGFASGDSDADGVVQIRMNNVTTEGALIWDKVRRVPRPKNLADLIAEPGDILFNATNSPELVGKSALFPGYDEPVTFSNHFIRLRFDAKRVVPGYVVRWLHEQWMRRTFDNMCKRWVNQASVGKNDLLSLSLPLPPLKDQERIAAILDQADSLRRLRQQANDRLNSLGQAIFNAMFGDPVTNPMGWDDQNALGEVAEIVSGVAKGRKLNGSPTRPIPYMAVVNVQDHELRLETVKVIDATEDEIARYRLRKNDLLLTEGGDPDKLGRGALWNDEIPESIHQNHIFRVRLNSDRVDPVFLNWLIGGKRGKAYFLKSAKQTTGIASINMTQLRGFPLLLPPAEIQQQFARCMATVKRQQAVCKAGVDTLDLLFSSLQHRAFRGEL